MDEQQEFDKVLPVDLSKEMKASFLDYSMSVIVSRALPDVRDGLKPVHRRILYAMSDLGIVADKPYKKSARIVGEVIGKYHPHGDSAVYETMVRMAQDFTYRYELIQGHGNFGSIDGDGAAAQRYTEARMSKIAMELVRDIKSDTIDFRDNYDGEEREPEVLPSRFPNLLVNGTTGIAVGMATNIPPHNLNETIDATIALVNNPDLSPMDIFDQYLLGPDFPTGGFILGRAGIKKAYETGNGHIYMRAKTHFEEMNSGKTRIVVTEIPFQVNKAKMVEKIAELVKDKRIEGITDLRDESNRNGIRVVVELRRDVQPDVVLNQLFKLTAMQSTFGINMLALVNGKPEVLNIQQMLQHYIDHQIEVIIRRTKFELKKATDRAHILEGLMIALNHIDEVIALLKASRTTEEAHTRLMEEFKLSDRQAKAIREMQLQRLTGLETEKIQTELNDLAILIADLTDIINSESRVKAILCSELEEIKSKYGDQRRTEIIEHMLDLEDEDLIPVEQVVVSLTTKGYIKRTTIDHYRAQNRGGKGIKGMSTNEDDVVDQLIALSTHSDLLFFTNLGRVYRLRGHQVPEYARTGKGIPVINLLDLQENETVLTMINVTDYLEESYLLFVTLQGIVKRVDLAEFQNIRKSGKIALSLKEDDALVRVKMTTGDLDIVIGGSNGKAIRFKETDIRVMGRSASGVRGFNVDGGHVIGMTTSNEGSQLLAVTEFGYGKMSPIDDYRLSHRGAKGVKTVNVTEKNGDLIALRAVNGDEDLMIITNEGIMIRLPLEQVKVAGRNTQGVRLIRLNEGQSVATVAIVQKEEQTDEETELDA